jgi:Acyl-protein synthetase, LuxE
MIRDAEARQLEDRLLEWMATVPAGFVADGTTRAERYDQTPAEAAATDQRFDELARALFEHQYERVPVYRAYCRALGRTPDRITASTDIPPLPVEAYKRARVATFPAELEIAAFHTSGTTGAGTGVLHLDGLALYDLALERGFAHHVLPDRDTIRMVVLAAPLDEARHSSLSYMLQRVLQRWGAPGSATPYHDGEVRWRELRAVLEAARDAREPVCLLGTAFAWVHVLEACARETFRIELPEGSRVFETGGYKGRTRELSTRELHAGFDYTFGVPATHVVGEYGMTEMGSQLYTTSLRRTLGAGAPADDTWSYPAWLRPRILDSATGATVDPEATAELGLLAHHDLANRASVAHLLTADLAEPRGPSFVLAGRCPRADLRGCGLVYERGSVSS